MVLGVTRSNNSQNKARETRFLNKVLELHKDDDRLYYVPKDMEQLDALLSQALEVYCRAHTVVSNQIETIARMRGRDVTKTMMTARKILSLIYSSLAVDDTLFVVGL